jgi:hypothetical protein
MKIRWEISIKFVLISPERENCIDGFHVMHVIAAMLGDFDKGFF